MNRPRAYLDWNATTPVHPAAKSAMLSALDLTGNPSSIHAEGRAARALMEAARADVAALVGGEAANVVFTSGATEAINAILTCGLCAPCAGKASGGKVFASATEHSAVFAAAPDAVTIPVGADGTVSPEVLAAMLAEAGPGATVFIQLANNETGIVQPIAALARVVQAAGGFLVCDAVQAPGKIAVDLATLGADALIITAHKFGGPKGAGAIIFRNAETRLARAFITGGGQESGQRCGTENLSGIAGLAAVARAAKADLGLGERLAALRDGFEAKLRALVPQVVIAGENSPRLPNTCLFAVPGLTADRALIAFDLDGVAVSSGSACSSGKVKASHVLVAMGAGTALQQGAIRVSIGPTTTENELEACLGSLARQVERVRKQQSAA